MERRERKRRGAAKGRDNMGGKRKKGKWRGEEKGTLVLD